MYAFFVCRNEKRWRLSRGDHCREVVISRGLTLFHFFESISLQRECICCSCLIYWRWICHKFLFDMAVPWELSNSQWDSEFSFLMLRTQLEIHVLTQRIISIAIFCPQFFYKAYNVFLCRPRWWQSCLEQTVDCQSRYLDIQS